MARLTIKHSVLERNMHRTQRRMRRKTTKKGERGNPSKTGPGPDPVLTRGPQCVFCRDIKKKKKKWFKRRREFRKKGGDDGYTYTDRQRGNRQRRTGDRQERKRRKDSGKIKGTREESHCVFLHSICDDGCIVCPKTDSTFDLRSGEIREWYPNNPIRRALTPALRSLFVYPVKTDDENIDISIGDAAKSIASAEIVFSGKAQPGVTAADVNIRMVVGERLEGFGFTGKNELINGKAAVIGFLLLLDFELLTGKGLLKGTGFLDFIHSVSAAFK